MRWKFDDAIHFIAYYAAARGYPGYVVAMSLAGLVIERMRRAGIKVKDKPYVKSSYVQHHLTKIEEIAQR